MSTVTLFLLIVLASGHRQVAVVDGFLTAPACESAKAQIVAGPQGEYAGYVRCVRAEVARPER